MDLNNLNIEDLKAKILTFTDEKTLIKSGCLLYTSPSPRDS